MEGDECGVLIITITFQGQNYTAGWNQATLKLTQYIYNYKIIPIPKCFKH